MVKPRVIIYPDGTNGLPQSIKRQIIDGYHAYFPPKIYDGKDPDEWFERPQDYPVRFVIVIDSTVISHAAVICRTITINEEQFQVAGLGGVFTTIHHRKKGYAGVIVREAMAYMDTKGFDLAALFCLPNNQGFYQKLGWKTFRHPNILVGPSAAGAKPLPDDERCMIRFLSEKSLILRHLPNNQPIYFGEEW